MNQIPQEIIDGLVRGGVYALIALGYTMVYGVLQLINFAHGDIFMVGAFTAFFVARRLGPAAAQPAGLVLVVGSSIVACVILGVAIERLAYRPVRNAPRLTALITAIGVSLLLENGGQKLWSPDPRTFPTLVPDRVVAHLGPATIRSQQVLILVATALMLAGLQFFVSRTRPGRAMRAVAFRRDAASLMGINPDRIITLTFAIGCGLAGIAAVLVGVYDTSIDPLMGLMYGLKAFVAAVVGGIGSIPGAAVGGLILGVVEMLVAGSPLSQYRDAIAFALLVGVLLFRPAGVLGKGVAEKV